MKRYRSIAVAQTCPVAGMVDANLGEHICLARIAADEGAKIVVFPELSLIGYELAMADPLAFSETDARLNPLLDVAATHGITLIVGAPVRIGSSLHIGAFIVSPERTTSLYTKHRLGTFPQSAGCDSCDGSVPPPEASVFQPGDRNPLLDFNGHGSAVAVCADIGDPAHAERAAHRGADCYLASMFVIPSDFSGEVAKLSRYAHRHRMMTALANFGSSTGGLRSAGCSSIWSEKGELLVRLKAEGSGVAIVIETGSGPRTNGIMLPRD